MTFEQLLEMSGDELDKMNKEELYKFFDTLLPKTRPELAIKSPENSKQIRRPSSRQERIEQYEMDLKMQKAKEIMKQFGIKTDGI